MKFGIIGPISKDRLITPAGTTDAQFGGVAYAAVALARMIEGTGDEVVCLSHLAADDRAEARSLLAVHGVRLLADQADGRGTEIDISPVSVSERVSRQRQAMTPIGAREIEALADCGYILLMPLNDTDIPLDSLRHLRQHSRATIFLDLHGLITGRDEEGRRYRRIWTGEDDWLANIDILKMNDKEAPWAAGRRMDDYGEYAEYAVDAVRQGVSVCWITFGDRSSLVAWRRDRRIFWTNVPVMDIGQAVDTVGCGDAASAGFIYSYAKLGQPVLAVVLGNTIGSAKASLGGADTFPTKPEIRGMVYQHYRDYLHALLDEFLCQQRLIIHEVQEDSDHESTLHRPDGFDHRNGADRAGGSHRQSPPAAGPRSQIPRRRQTHSRHP